MTPLTADTPSALTRTEPLRRAAPVDAVRPASTGSGNAPGNAVAGGTGSRPGVVVNLESSVGRAALSGITYGNPRSSAAQRAAEADPRTPTLQAPATRSTAPVEMRNTPTTLAATRADADSSVQTLTADRQAQQAAAASGALRQGMAAYTSA